VSVLERPGLGRARQTANLRLRHGSPARLLSANWCHLTPNGMQAWASSLLSHVTRSTSSGCGTGRGVWCVTAKQVVADLVTAFGRGTRGSAGAQTQWTLLDAFDALVPSALRWCAATGTGDEARRFQRSARFVGGTACGTRGVRASWYLQSTDHRGL